MPSVSEYSVERRGGKYYIYRPNGSKMPGASAFVGDKEGVTKLYTMVAQLNAKAAKS